VFPHNNLPHLSIIRNDGISSYLYRKESSPMAIKCEACGMEYEQSPGKFCDRCGRVLARLSFDAGNGEPDYRRCHKCGFTNELDATVCKDCGELIHEPQVY
jgi:rRNA maturation endonuclease Nob1